MIYASTSVAFFLTNDYSFDKTFGFGRGITYSNGDVKNNFFDRYCLSVSSLVFHIRKLSFPMHLFFSLSSTILFFTDCPQVVLLKITRNDQETVFMRRRKIEATRRSDHPALALSTKIF